MDPQAHGYTVVTFHPESKGIVIYFVPKDGSGKGTMLNINHDIVPQAIDKTLAGVSVAVPPKLIRLKCANHHNKGNLD